ncbi:cytochrome c oxidase assembly protein [Algicola sagamiensis]|uniref:cytochrome c oxidase assembly protein n=1 Tax=Algicola sagamiensis TaxID=163869 RepID=UPI000381A2CF|nr:cytochrome c oxidase assembly protein [Algicola sagamiensis]
MDSQRLDNTALVKRLVLITLAMFGFGFMLVPLYDVFCDVTGLNGKTSDTAAQAPTSLIDESREVTVEFWSRTQGAMPWEFQPTLKKIKVHPGKVTKVFFRASNRSNDDMVGQAIPSVSPGLAANYFHKIECFCFNQQPVKAGETVDMPLIFYVDPALPAKFTTLTLSYTMFDISNQIAATSLTNGESS